MALFCSHFVQNFTWISFTLVNIEALFCNKNWQNIYVLYRNSRKKKHNKCATWNKIGEFAKKKPVPHTPCLTMMEEHRLLAVSLYLPLFLSLSLLLSLNLCSQLLLTGASPVQHRHGQWTVLRVETWNENYQKKKLYKIKVRKCGLLGHEDAFVHFYQFMAMQEIYYNLICNNIL